MLFCNWILGDVFMVNLSRLEEIKDLRTIWLHEALDFTPWLAQDDNIAWLADAAGLDILDNWSHVKDEKGVQKAFIKYVSTHLGA